MTEAYRLERRPHGGKLCSRCAKWFIPGPRERVCFPCLRPSEKAVRAQRPDLGILTVNAQTHTRVPTRHFNRQNAQVRRLRNPLGRAICMELAREAAYEDHFFGVSSACSRRHHDECIVKPCACAHHVKAYGGTS